MKEQELILQANCLLRDHGHIQPILAMILTGSYAYGTAVLDSDIDLRVITYHNLADYLSVFSTIQNHWHIQNSLLDIQGHDLIAFMHILGRSIPNTVELLWTPRENILMCHPCWDDLVEQRDLFMSQQFYWALLGETQERIKRPADAKTMAQLVRLLRMGIEYLQSGKLEVARKDARELVRIRQGDWSDAHLKTEIQVLGLQLRSEMENSDLPEKTDITRINLLCSNLLVNLWGKDITNVKDMG